jgi:hypothetical protein
VTKKLRQKRHEYFGDETCESVRIRQSAFLPGCAASPALDLARLDYAGGGRPDDN